MQRFNGSGGAIYDILLTQDGGALIAGDFELYEGLPGTGIVKVAPDGTQDTNFFPLKAPLGTSLQVNSLASQPDGKLLFGGSYTNQQTGTDGYYGRLNPDGSNDPLFFVNGGADATVSSVLLQPDGFVLMGGFFTTISGNSRAYLARLASDGLLDFGFNVQQPGPDAPVLCMALQPDGKILVGGQFNAYNAVAANHIVRLNPDGGIDTTFRASLAGSFPGGMDGDVYSIVVQPDGRILVGGQFQNAAGRFQPYITRLNADGTADQSFAPATGPNGPVLELLVEPANTIVIGGAFTAYDDVVRNYVARINVDGTLSGGSAPVSGLRRIVAFGATPEDVAVERGFELFVQSIDSMVVDGKGRLVAGTRNPDAGYAARMLVSEGPSPVVSRDTSFTPFIAAPVQDVAVDAGGVVYYASEFNVTTPALLGPLLPTDIVALNDLGENVYTVSTYDLQCPTGCTDAGCGALTGFQGIVSLGVSASGALRIVDDVFEDPNLPVECRESLRVVLLDVR